MKSEKAKKYLTKVVTPIAMMYPDAPEMCDLKLGEAKHAVELAEQEAEERMREKAVKAYCHDCCCSVVGKCEIRSENCMSLRDFIQKLTE